MTCPAPHLLTVTVGLRLCDVALAWRPCPLSRAERTVSARGVVEMVGEEWSVRGVVLDADDVEPLSREEERRVREAVEESLVDAAERQTQPL